MLTLQQISALVVEEMWGLLFNALLLGRMWELGFCSTESRLGMIDCLFEQWQEAQVEEKKKISFNIHCFLSIKQTIRQKFVRICWHKQL